MDTCMNDHDPADLDGDGRFDAIDIEIMEDGENCKQPQNGKIGCCMVLFAAVSLLSTGVWLAGNYLI